MKQSPDGFTFQLCANAHSGFSVNLYTESRKTKTCQESVRFSTVGTQEAQTVTIVCGGIGADEVRLEKDGQITLNEITVFHEFGKQLANSSPIGSRAPLYCLKGNGWDRMDGATFALSSAVILF